MHADNAAYQEARALLEDLLTAPEDGDIHAAARHYLATHCPRCGSVLQVAIGDPARNRTVCPTCVPPLYPSGASDDVPF